MAEERDVGMGIEVGCGDYIDGFGLQKRSFSQQGHDA